MTQSSTQPKKQGSKKAVEVEIGWEGVDKILKREGDGRQYRGILIS